MRKEYSSQDEHGKKFTYVVWYDEVPQEYRKGKNRKAAKRRWKKERYAEKESDRE